MRHDAPKRIDLEENEEALLGRVSFDLAGLGSDDAARSLDAACELAKSLIARRAVPQARLDYFTNPELNVGGGGSRKEVFESNGTEGEAILRHPHFLQFLRYFIYGPDLPPGSMAGLCRIVNEDAGTSGEVMMQLKQFVRSEVRSKRLDRTTAAEEFFKLAIELGCDPQLCRVIRDAARTTR
jgi:hypothetical protein